MKLDGDGNPLQPRPPDWTECHEFEMSAHLAVLTFQAGDTELRLVFDTGAGGCVLRHDLLDHPGLVRGPLTHEELVGSDPRAHQAVSAEVSGLRIGGKDVPAMQVVFSTASVVPGIDGIVGLPWVAGRAFAINYRKRVLALRPRMVSAEAR